MSQIGTDKRDSFQENADAGHVFKISADDKSNSHLNYNSNKFSSKQNSSLYGYAIP